MQKDFWHKLAKRISVIGICCFTAGSTGSAWALTVHDPAHTAVSKLNKAELIKQLAEMKKQYDELVKQTEYALNTMNKLGELKSGSLSANFLMRQSEKAAICAIPELRNMRIPDGNKASFLSICESAETVRGLVLPSSEGEVYDGIPLSGRDHITRVRERRDGLHEDATIMALATSQTALQTQKDSTQSVTDLISESNQAQTVDELLRVQIKADAAILTKLTSIELLLAQGVRLLSTVETRSLRTTVTTQDRVLGE
ncbi:hypothetical protein O4H49_20140 [Kiloniella laminariae]|uniref:Type IV secretion system protein VirB5 n=1 Tax=Kiloniella laminariae TaxID=454162 RepID=A0ABT4LPT7_9PROT|nr:hypothetical protein [Kiloniella laminariae]MCZ4283106.1 hypothetical protein [Kiloniella laminariae]